MPAATSRRLDLIAAAFIAAMTSGFAAWRSLNGAVLADEVLHVYGVILAIPVFSWLATDPKIPASQRPSFDHGMLIWATFPLLAAYQMFAAHRWQGILIVLGLMALFAAPNIAVALIAGVS